MKEVVKAYVALIAILSATATFAMPQETIYPITGEQAAEYFQKLPKITPSCAYGEDVIIDKEPYSVLCKQIVEDYACEVSSLIVANPQDACK
jgi:hypothetical protein